MIDFLQQLFSGIALGCVYGLIALGFVLIYKATEVVNFAQGEVMMIGAFLSYTFIATMGLNYWLGFAMCILGYPQFSIVMATIGLGLVLRALAGIIWGTDDLRIETPFTGGVVNVGQLVLSLDSLSIIAATAVLCGVLYAFFRFTRLGIAMQATSQNMLAAYYMGIPVKRMFSLIWSLSSAVACAAGVLLAPITLIHANLGFLGIKAFPAAVLGGFGSIPGAVAGGIVIGIVESMSGFYLPEGFKDVAAYIVVLAVLLWRPQGMFGSNAIKKV